MPPDPAKETQLAAAVALRHGKPPTAKPDGASPVQEPAASRRRKEACGVFIFGIENAAMPEPEDIVLHLLQEIRQDVKKLDNKVDNLSADIRSATNSLRADVAPDLLAVEKRLGDQLVTLRRSVMEYHSTAVAHGMLYSEIEERVRKIEQRLDGGRTDAH